MQVDAVIARLKAEVPALRTVAAAADMMQLMKANGLPQITPAAHVVPAGLRGGSAEAMAGAFIQNITEAIGIVITFRNTDAAGAKGLAQADDVITDILTAVAGWGPEDAPGVFALVRGSVLSMEATTMVYLLEFSIPLQLRNIA